MIVSAHDGGCLWRRRGCDGEDTARISLMDCQTDVWPDTIQRLPLAHQAAALEGLRHRYDSLTAMESDLPPTLSAPDHIDLAKLANDSRSALQQKPSSAASVQPGKQADTSKEPPDSSLNVNLSAFTLAIFGWQAEEDHISGLATCTACFRRLGLWLFKPSPEDLDSTSSMDRLDVLGEHREYCPWINALSQNGASRRSSLDGMAAWEVLSRHVRNSAMLRRDSMGMTTMHAEQRSSDAASEVVSVADTEATAAEDKAATDKKDQERWAKLKRLKQVFQARKKPGV